MLLKIDDWDRIREHFTDAEKKILNEAISGFIICPRVGCMIDEEKAGSVLVKVKTLLREDS